MNKIIKSFILISIPVFISIFFLAGCKKEITNPSQQIPTISAVYPSSGIANAPVVIKGLNLKNVTRVQFGTRVVTNLIHLEIQTPLSMYWCQTAWLWVKLLYKCM